MIADLVALNRVAIRCEIKDCPAETCTRDKYAVFMQL
jgi:hypothetical protein